MFRLQTQGIQSNASIGTNASNEFQTRVVTNPAQEKKNASISTRVGTRNTNKQKQTKI